MYNPKRACARPAIAALHSHKRAQVQSVDAVLALASFVILLMFVLNSWADLRQQSQSSTSISRLEATAMSISDELVNSPGVPYDWETRPIELLALGFAPSPGALSLTKLANFTALNYSSAKTVLGVDKNFYIVVSDTNWSPLYSLGATSAPANLSVAVTRLATLNGKPVRVRVVVYE